MLVNELIDGTEIDQVLLVREAERRQRKDGGDYLRLQLGDRTGALACMVWEELGEVEELACAGSAVRVRGRYTVHPRFGPQINLRGLQPAEPGTFSLDDLLDGPVRAVEQMEREIRELIATIQEPHLGLLLERVFGEESELWQGYREAPAAKYYHQAYRHGLLEHCLGVAQAVSAISATFPGIDRDVAVTGALLHDIGKLEAYTDDPQNIDLTDAGRLQGEIPLGYYRIRRAIEDIDGFPAQLAQAVVHIILSHHGTLEHGSPVVPCTREATLVHMIDNLGGRLGSFDRLEKELAPGRRWSSFDRAIGGGAFFSERGEATVDATDQRQVNAPAHDREAAPVELSEIERPAEPSPGAEVGDQITLPTSPAREAA
ncbi:MAG TPA: HD domain-containing protein [Solirubrobacteraceae bacterium]|jgi:3'-5' exoribonuclease|nr:HD domain-containing protein [Solirubrobacteraceae bacterium]